MNMASDTPQLVRADGRPARIALVHEWFDHFYGSERVAAEILACFPSADVFTLVDIMTGEDRRFLDGKTVHTSFIQRLPFGKSPRFRHYLPLFPLAIEQFDLGGYDLVLSSSHAVAKGVLTGSDQLHIAYVHTPMRYAWELQHEYLRQARLDRGLKGMFARYMMHKLRLWDLRTVNGVDRFIANSAYVAGRIEKTYRRESVVIHPPVDVDRFELGVDKQDHYLAVSRFVPYKHTETIVDAFIGMPDKRLIVIGDGPGLKAAKARATPNITLLPPQPFEALERHMRRAKAFIFAPEEDFGITPVEAQAAGTPVIAYGAGGALETVRDLEQTKPTGLFFDAQTPESIRRAVGRFEQNADAITAEHCRENALRFAAHHFRARYVSLVVEAWQAAGGDILDRDEPKVA
ncbi:MAG: glycosyltransferase family 4 protein [Alphaproteobacteria bacterium]|nr:glycosyltransferase family 4 protein [Alphaproteobacteria bacterium]